MPLKAVTLTVPLHSSMAECGKVRWKSHILHGWNYCGTVKQLKAGLARRPFQEFRRLP